MIRPAVLVAATLGFVALATANSGGYRYGVSDQAFYTPSVIRALDEAAYPRDAALIDVQATLMLGDDLLASLVGLSGADLPPLFLAIYVLTLVGLLAAAVLFARWSGYSWWAVAVLGLLLTLRHRIAKAGANSLEGYMHTRMLAFVMGVAALACLVRGRPLWAFAAVAVSAAVHPTTALWFGLALAIGLTATRPAWRWPLVILGSMTAIGAGVALAPRLVVMDAAWLAVLAGKDYLFPAEWPAYAWITNLGYPLVILAIYRNRRRLDVLAPGEPALVAGLLGLCGLFLLSVPLTSARLALAVQLQVTRVFWVLDFAAAAYVAWWLTTRRPDWIWWRPAIVSAIAVVSLARGAYVMAVEHPDRPLIEVRLAATEWTEAMNWLRTQPDEWHVLADPDHAWKYGSSVRVAAAKDTVLEVSKDAALAIYDDTVAERIAERTVALSEFHDLTLKDILHLDARYDLDVLIRESDKPLALPVLFRNRRFVVYDLR